MRYYLYRDIEFLKEIYSQFDNLRLDLDVIERIDAKTCSEEAGIFVEPESKFSDKQDIKVKFGARNTNRNSVTTIAECANISDIKDIYNKRFYHGLIQNLRDKKVKCPGICFECGKIKCIDNRQESEDEFIEINGVYIWFEQSKISNDIHVLSKITDDVEIIGIVIRSENSISPKIVKAIAIYVDI